MTANKSWRSNRSYHSALSLGSAFSFASVGALFSAGSILSIGSAGSILSIGRDCGPADRRATARFPIRR